MEPDSWNCALLRRNLAANGFTDWAQVIEAAVGSSGGFGRLVRHAEGGEFSFFPHLFRLGRRPRLIIVEVHAAYGDTDALLAVFRQSGDSVSLADRVPPGAWFPCWLT